MSGTVLKQLIERGGKINTLSEELLRLIEESSNPAYRAWDLEQSIAVMLESNSLVFSLIDHVETMDSNSRLVLIEDLLDEVEDVDGEIFFDTIISLLRIANRRKIDSVEAFVVQDIAKDLSHLWKEVVSQEERNLFKTYLMSDKPLYFIKNKLSAVQVSEILKEVTREKCPFRNAIPSYILIPMETIAATANLVTWIGAADPQGWLDNLTTVKEKTEASKKPPRLPVLIQKQHSAVVLEDKSPQRGKGIDMFPIPSGKTVKPKGISFGAQKQPPSRINFKVHGDSPLRRLKSYMWTY